MDLDELVGETKEEELKVVGLVQIFFQKRNNRKGWTLIEGLEGDLKELVGKLQKKFSCNVSVGKDKIVKMNGTYRDDLVEFLKLEMKIDKIEIL